MKKNIFKLSADTNTIVSFSAIIVSIASIFIATWQGIESRRHNLLSVRPKLDLSFEVGRNSFGYSIKNQGLGSAIITERKIFLDGKEFIPQTKYFGWAAARQDTLRLMNMNLDAFPLSKGVTIRAGEPWIIIQFFEQDNKDLTIDPKMIYRRLAFKINYESMYGEPFTCQIPK